MIDGIQAGSLLNDQAYAARIYANLRQALGLAREPVSLRRLRQWVAGQETEPETEPTA